jgi:hypothetical protein
MAWPSSGRTKELSEGVALCHYFSVNAFAHQNNKLSLAEKGYAGITLVMGARDLAILS